MNDPVDMRISRQTIPGQVDIIAIEIEDGPKILLRLEVTPDDFLSALVSGKIVLAAMSKG